MVKLLPGFASISNTPRVLFEALPPMVVVPPVWSYIRAPVIVDVDLRIDPFTFRLPLETIIDGVPAEAYSMSLSIVLAELPTFTVPPDTSRAPLRRRSAAVLFAVR